MKMNIFFFFAERWEKKGDGKALQLHLDMSLKWVIKNRITNYNVTNLLTVVCSATATSRNNAFMTIHP